MSIYMKFDDINGPVTYDGSKGWIELQSAQIVQSRPVTTPGKRGREAPSITEIIATKDQDSASTALFKQALQGEGKTVTIVFVKGEDPRDEFLRLKLEGTLISNYSISGAGGGNRPMESFTLNFTNITFERGGSAHASLMVRPQDWGSLKAMEEFNRTRQA